MKKTIILIEDDKNDSAKIKRVLEAAGYLVICFFNLPAVKEFVVNFNLHHKDIEIIAVIFDFILIDGPHKHVTTELVEIMKSNPLFGNIRLANSSSVDFTGILMQAGCTHCTPPQLDKSQAGEFLLSLLN